MQMGAKARALGHNCNDAVAQLLRIERADSYTVERTALGNHFQQLRKLDRRFQVAAVSSQVNPGEYHFLETLLRKTVQSSKNLARRDAARSTPRDWDDAKRA